MYKLFDEQETVLNEINNNLKSKNKTIFFIQFFSTFLGAIMGICASHYIIKYLQHYL